MFREQLKTHQIRAEDYLNEVPAETRALLHRLFGQAVVESLRRDRAICLDRLGIVFPCYTERSLDTVAAEKITTARAIVRSVGFEKCIEPSKLQQEKYGTIASLKDVAPYLSVQLRRHGVPWSEFETLRYLRGLTRYIADDVAARGCTDEFGVLGRFLALHNRQGRTVDEWYNGADVFVASNHVDQLSVSEPRSYARPTVKQPHEPIIAMFGSTLHTFRVNVATELGILGYDPEPLTRQVPVAQQSFGVGVFDGLSPRGNGFRRFIYVSDRLRNVTSPQRRIDALSEESLPSELVLELELPASAVEATPPRWPIRAFVLGWVLMQSSPGRAARTGSGITIAESLDTAGSTLTSVLISPWKRIVHPLRGEESDFRFLSLVGITNDELHVAEQYSASLLLSLLEHKDMDQVTKPDRSSILLRSSFSGDHKAAPSQLKERFHILAAA